MTKLNEEGSRIRCDRCGAIEDGYAKIESGEKCGWEIETHWRYEIFQGRHKPDLGDFCYRCALDVTPLVYQLRDIDELNLFVNRLERAINAKRRENNRAT